MKKTERLSDINQELKDGQVSHDSHDSATQRWHDRGVEKANHRVKIALGFAVVAGIAVLYFDLHGPFVDAIRTVLGD